ncbi:MAG: hypothetical protein MPJ22_02215 [Pirellulales bacterium]|nr:hypothetical protein [Pirellulales bacterium]
MVTLVNAYDATGDFSGSVIKASNVVTGEIDSQAMNLRVRGDDYDGAGIGKEFNPRWLFHSTRSDK